MDRLAVRGRPSLIGADHGEFESRTALLLGEGRQHMKALVSDGKVGPAALALVVAHRDPVLALTWHLVHGRDDRPGAVIRPPVDAAAHEKVRAEFVRRDETSSEMSPSRSPM